MGSDLQICKQIYEESFSSKIEYTWDKILKKLHNNDFFILCLKFENVIVGCSILSQNQYFCFIEYLCISSIYRGCGYGKTLFKESIEHCKKLTTYVMLDCKYELLLFYKKLNCDISSIVYHKGINFYRMLYKIV